MIRRALTTEEKEEAQRLERAWQQFKESHPHVKQIDIAEKCGWTTAAAFAQYITGAQPLNLDALCKVSTALEIDASEISPRLALRATTSLAQGIKPKSTTSATAAPMPGKPLPHRKFTPIQQSLFSILQSLIDQGKLGDKACLGLIARINETVET